MSDDRVSVRRLGADDWQLQRDLRLQALQDAPDAFWATYDSEAGFDEARWRSRLDGSRDSATWVAELHAGAAGAPVGLCTGFVDPGSDTADPSGTVHLVSLWVAPGARGLGIASHLIDAVVAWARERDLRRISLWVVDSNDAATRLYARHGFRPTGQVGTFPEPRGHLTEHEQELLLG